MLPRCIVFAPALLGAAFASAPSWGQTPPIAVVKPWFRYIIPQVPAGGYMTLQNQSSRAVVLDGATSPACGMMMLHRSETRNGSETMALVPSIAVPPGESLSFAPGGYHLMCMEPKMKPGQHVQVTLRFQNGQTVSIIFPVFSVNQQPNAQ